MYRYTHQRKLGTQITTQVVEFCSTEEDAPGHSQELLFKYPPAPLCASGGNGCGKTAGFFFKIHFLSQCFPGMRWAVGRNKLKDLTTTTMPTFFKWCPVEAYSYGGRRSDTDKILRYNNGSEILWLHFDDPEKADVIKGLEINGFLLNQAEDIEEDIFERLSGRLGRWDKAVVPQNLLDWYTMVYQEPWPWISKPPESRPEVPAYAFVDCNPDAEDHWIYQRFHPESPAYNIPRGTPDDPKPSFKAQGYKMLMMDSTKNRFLSEQNKELMLNNDESYVRRYVRGLWGIPEGQIHDIHRSSKIDGTPELETWLAQHCTLMRVLDHGDSAATCCTWWAIDESGNMFCYREYYLPNALIQDHRKNITALSGNEKYTFNIADPQIFLKTMQKGQVRFSVADEYSNCIEYPRETALFFTEGDNDEMGTRDRISALLRFHADRINPITKERGSPQMFFLMANKEYPHGCVFTTTQVTSQRREQIGTYLGKPQFSDKRRKDIVDHAYDTVRYAVASHAPSIQLAQAVANPNSFNEARKRAIAARSRGAVRVMAHRAKMQADRSGYNRGR